MKKKLYITGVFTLAGIALAAIPKVADFLADQICRLIPDRDDDENNE